VNTSIHTDRSTNLEALVAYYTQFGNTKKIAEVLAEELSSAGKARVMPIDGLTVADLADADLVLFGSPTHYQNLPKAVRAALDALPKRALRGKGVAAFDTSLETWGPLMWMTAAHRLLPRLRKLGGKPIARPETFLVVRGLKPGRGEDPESGERQDALVEGELERARAWAASILERISQSI
jgi:flavodoxin